MLVLMVLFKFILLVSSMCGGWCVVVMFVMCSWCGIRFMCVVVRF